MDPMSPEELARRTGVLPEDVRRLTGLGILAPGGDGLHQPSDIRRVRIVEAMTDSGISVEDLGAMVGSGELSFAFVDLLPTPQAGLSDRTLAETARDLGVPLELLERMFSAWGLPAPAAERPVREDDAEVLPAVGIARSSGLPEDTLPRVARMYGESMRRVADFDVATIHDHVEEPLRRSGLSYRQQLELATQVGSLLTPLVEQGLIWLYRRHLEHGIIADIVEHVEAALEAAGIPRARPANPPAIGFLDLSGFTRLTEERGDEIAAEYATTLAELVRESTRGTGGRPVKLLGDGVMFHFADAAEAVRCLLQLVEEVPRRGLPPAHAGLNAGPVVVREGDYFGRTVNLAARIAGAAGAGEVLVSRTVVEACEGRDLDFHELEPVELKGVGAVPLFRPLPAGPGAP